MTAWYVARGGQQSGPLTREQLQQMAQSGQLGADAYVAGPEVSGWTPSAQLPWLAAPGYPPAQPPAAQPYAPAYAAPQPYAHPGYGAAPMGTPMGAQANAAFPLGMPGDVASPAHRGQPKSSWVKERLRGLGAIALALLMVALNVFTLMTEEAFYPKTLIVGLGALGYGGWVIIFGDEYDDYTLELVKWKQIGMYACGAGGALLGLVLSFLLAA